MSRRSVGCLVLLVLGLGAANASAAYETRVRLLVTPSQPIGDFADRSGSGVGLGVQGEYRAWRGLSLGLETGFFGAPGERDETSITLTDPETGQTGRFTLDESWTITRLGLYGRWSRALRTSIVPYVRAGAGVYGVRYKQDLALQTATFELHGSVVENRFGLNGGLGIDFGVLGRTTLGLVGDVHYLFVEESSLTYADAGVVIGFGVGR